MRDPASLICAQKAGHHRRRHAATRSVVDQRWAPFDPRGVGLSELFAFAPFAGLMPFFPIR